MLESQERFLIKFALEARLEHLFSAIGAIAGVA